MFIGEGKRSEQIKLLHRLPRQLLYARRPPTRSAADALKIFEDSDQHISSLLTNVVMPQLTGKQPVNKARALRPGLKPFS